MNPQGLGTGSALQPVKLAFESGLVNVPRRNKDKTQTAAEYYPGATDPLIVFVEPAGHCG